MKKHFELEWDDSMGEGWMNIFNLELCLFSKGHSKPELIKVRELEVYKDPVPFSQVRYCVLKEYDDHSVSIVPMDKETPCYTKTSLEP